MSDGGISTIVGSTFRDCSATTTGKAGVYYGGALGGALYLEGKVLILNSTLLRCSTIATDDLNAFGGGIYISEGNISLVNVNVNHCTSNASLGRGSGGGLYASGSRVLLSDQSVITGCHASSAGHSMNVGPGAFVTYVLPAPPGRYISATICAVYREACPRNYKTQAPLDKQCPDRAIACSQDTTVNASVK